MEGLPTKVPMKDRINGRECWICPRGTLRNAAHGIRLRIDYLKPGQLLHMNYYFMNNILRAFIAVLLIRDTDSSAHT